MKALLWESFLLFLFLCLHSIHQSFGATDTIATTHFLKDGDDNITSPGGIFEMGFFSPDNSENRYVGMWYKNVSDRTVVWVANREAPLRSGSGILKIIKSRLVLVDGTNNVVWSTNTSRLVQNPVAQLLDSGNLVVKEAGDDNSGNLIWQSFDHPTDTLLAGMKLGRNFVTGREVYLSSWKNEEDPAPGDYTYHCDPTGYPQTIVKKGSDVVYSSGPWNGRYFSGTQNSRLVSHNGILQIWTLGDREQGWVPLILVPADKCEVYNSCGAYGSCNSQDSPVCRCLDKFVPNNSDAWKREDWSGGCVRKTKLNCLQRDVFLKYSHIKLPDTRNSWSNVTMTLEECKDICSKNCSCMAYSNPDIRGSGCLLWFGDLLDIRKGTNGLQEIYIRMAASESDNQEESDGKKGKVLFWILPLSVGLILVFLSLLIYHRRRKKALELKNKGRTGCGGNCAEEFEIPLFDLSTIANATNNFSIDRQIGEGGYGPVYKGILEGGEVAVKRLSRTSTQGENEFKNEVIYIAKLQHRNLVKILGCCIEGEEKMLIYEYLPNGSLDSFIFDDAQSKVLDWPKRFHIINENDNGAKTNRVVGTYGYLSPEYALHGRYSVKSDVFSFGILILEIVSGKSNRRFSHPDHNLNLLGLAWKLYKEGRSTELLDEYLGNSCSTPEVERSICVGLLCVQQCPEDRPSMSSVVMMLNNKGVLPQAKRPGFYIETDAPDGELSSSHTETPITILVAR
ncbi:hypothetical protein KY285_032165 [Solanum tuberosum]|nr:hypothetical protein KY285_032165 [Solanum tuberosum]